MGLRKRFGGFKASLNSLKLRAKSKAKKREEQSPMPVWEEEKSLFSTGIESSFPRFKELPAEIRLIIWELALPGPRIVHLELKPLKIPPFIRSGRVWTKWPTSSERPPRKIKKLVQESSERTLRRKHLVENPERINLSNLSGFHSKATPPALLYVCHESFAVAAKLYTQSFAAKCALGTTWFDFKRDTLLLTPPTDNGFEFDDYDQNNFLENIIPRISTGEVLQVENLAVGVKGALDPADRVYIWLSWTMTTFKNTKTFTYELPSTAASPGPWTNGDGAVEYFQRSEFERWHNDFQTSNDRGGKKRSRLLGNNWVMPEIVEKCVS